MRKITHHLHPAVAHANAAAGYTELLVCMFRNADHSSPAVMVGGGEMGAHGNNICMELRRTIRDGVAKFGRARTKYEEGERFMLSLVKFHRFDLYSSVPKPIATLPTINAYPAISGFASGRLNRNIRTYFGTYCFVFEKKSKNKVYSA